MKVGLILEGGALKGSYHIGSYYAFKHNKIEFDGFAGTSIGAFNAALLATGKEKELLEFWENLEPGPFLGIDQSLIETINSEKNEIKKILLGTFSSLKTWITDRGIKTDKLEEKLASLLDEEELRASSKDFGLVTVKLDGFQPIYFHKEDIKENQLIDYILASCYLPVFKMKKIIDDNHYIDGGFYDNCPVSILLDKGYDQVYAIRGRGIGLVRSDQEKYNDRVTYITASRNICRSFELDQQSIRENIKLGYYDTLRAIKNYDGYKYTFKNRSLKYYQWISRKVDYKEYQRVANFFNSSDKKETIIKAIEYISEKKYYDYYQVYNSYKQIKRIKKEEYKDHFVFNFIKKLKMF